MHINVPGRVVSILAVACATAIAAGCSSSGGNPNSSASSSAEKQAVKEAQAYVAPLEKKQTAWLGPTSGAPLAKGKSVVMFLNNTTSWNIDIAQDAAALGKEIGWKVTLLTWNSTTDPTGLHTLQQAIALHPDAIIPAAVSPLEAGSAFLQAKAQGIKVVSAASLAAPGSDPAYGILADVQLPPNEQAKALVDYSIVNSGGDPRFIEWYTSQFTVANAKGQAFAATVHACKTCTMLSLVNDGTAMGTPTGASSLMTSWLQKYGSKPIYASAIADSVWDNAMPALTSGGVSKSTVRLLGSDGSVSSFSRIRAGNYQIASTLMTPDEQIWTLFYDLNQAFHNQPVSTFNPRLVLLTKNNINAVLGASNSAQYYPDDNYRQHFLKIWGLSS